MKTEKGQALILIAFGIVAILGLTALAIDGGNAFADRRHAQNAADNAALAAALTRLNNGDWQQAAFTRAADNTYDNNGVSNEVFVHNPPIEGPYACPAHRCNDYIQVIIESRVDTWFARIVGVDFVNNRVHAVARAKPRTAYYDGHAVVALSPGDGNPTQSELTFSGNSLVTVEGSGIFINSSESCVRHNGGATSSVEGPITSVADCEGSVQGMQYPYPPSFPEFADLCSRPNAVPVTTQGNQGFPIQSDKIYCVTGNANFGSSDNYSATNVTIVMLNGTITINAQANLNLSSPPDLPLFYLPYSESRFNDEGKAETGVTINGGANLSLRGMVLAPASECKINGGSGTGIQGQVVCYEVDLSGGTGVAVIYEDGDNPDDPPHVELTQ